MKDAVVDALTVPFNHEWTVQGFGFLRCYLDEKRRFRLNVWHSDLTYPGVSTIHNHPWDFTSHVYGGVITNCTYKEYPEGDAYCWQNIRTGIENSEGQLFGDLNMTTLKFKDWKSFGRDTGYDMRWDEIHRTVFTDGAVSLNERFSQGSGDEARVFWKARERWGTAKVRLATQEEIVKYTAIGLKEVEV